MPVDFGFFTFSFVAMLTVIIGWSTLIFIGLFVGMRVGLGAPLLESWTKGEAIKDRVVSTLKISFALGIFVALAKFGLDRIILSNFIPSLMLQWKEIPFVLRWLIPFQQGIGDEIVLRLFWMTILVWIIYKIQKPENNQPTTIGVWIPILIVTILPIPAAFLHSLGLTLQFLIITVIGSIVFGWLYWKKGIESALIAHFTSSVLLVLLSCL